MFQGCIAEQDLAHTCGGSHDNMTSPHEKVASSASERTLPNPPHPAPSSSHLLTHVHPHTHLQSHGNMAYAPARTTGDAYMPHTGSVYSSQQYNSYERSDVVTSAQMTHAQESPRSRMKRSKSAQFDYDIPGYPPFPPSPADQYHPHAHYAPMYVSVAATHQH